MNGLFLGIAGFVLLLSGLTTAYLCSPSARFRLMDRPNERSLHTSLTPRTGGLAIIMSLLIGLAAALGWGWFCGHRCESNEFLAGGPFLFICQMLLIVIISFADDIRGIPVAIRFGVHAVAALGLVWAGGVIVNLIAFPGLGSLRLGWVAAPLSILFIVWMTNLYNFMDGIDGLAGGMTTIGFGFLGYLAWVRGGMLIAGFSLLIVAATIGFLLFNWPPARIFMGDVGSTALGFLAGSLSLKGVHDGLFDLWVPVLIFSPFGVDATVTVLVRLVRGQRVWRPHREHFYQRLVLAGWGHRKTMLAEYALMIAAGICALLYTRVNAQMRIIILIAWIIAYFVTGISIYRLSARRRLVGDGQPNAGPEMNRNYSIHI